MKRMTPLIAILAIWMATSVMAADQRPDPKVPQGKNLDVPTGWVVRTDHADHQAVVGNDAKTAEIYFVNMTPGWHITTTPAAIFYHPASTASGNYRARTVIHLFDPKGRNEAFGLFLGGEKLDGPDQTYDYFLIRNSGEYLIKGRRGEKTEVIRNWTKSDAIVPHEAGKSSVKNTLVVEAGPKMVDFLINGSKVASIPRSEIRTDGIVGLRINHRLNVHVEDLTVEPLTK